MERPGALLRAFLCAAISFVLHASAQQPFTLDAGREAAFLGTGIALNAVPHLLDIPEETLWQRYGGVDRAELPAWRRFASSQWHPKAKRASDILFLSAMVVSFVGPAVVHADDEPGLPLVVVGESFLLSSGLTSVTKALVRRPRPYLFNPDVPMEIRRSKEAYRSFWSGHAANISALTISAASLVDGPPISAIARTCIWASAVSVPLVMGWLRIRSGQHFPSDVLVGCVLGGLTGFLVPYIHRTEKLN